jgi:hypothetical protein
MIYSYPGSFKTQAALCEFTRRYLTEHNLHHIYQVTVPIPIALRQLVDAELAEYGLSKSIQFLAFKRRGYFGDDARLINSPGVHVDWNDKLNRITKASIIFPVEGCQDTYMYWVDGKYSTETAFAENQNGKPISNKKVCWAEPGAMGEKAYITEVPTVVRTDIPHSATSRSDGTYRTILSLRLRDNESFDSIVEKIKAKETANGR